MLAKLVGPHNTMKSVIIALVICGAAEISLGISQYVSITSGINTGSTKTHHNPFFEK
jgi:hypothetical protein